MKKRAVVVVMCALASVNAIAGLSGCSLFSATGPTIEPAASYTGPAVSVDASGRTHLVRITCPTGGWSARHDLTRDAWPDPEVFITLVSPAPGTMVTQALTELVVDTRVSSAQGCRVLIRMAEEVPTSVATGAYREAAHADARAR